MNIPSDWCLSQHTVTVTRLLVPGAESKHVSVFVTSCRPVCTYYLWFRCSERRRSCPSWFSARVPIPLNERIPNSIEFGPRLPDSGSIIDRCCPVFEAQMVEYQWPETKPHTGQRSTFICFTSLSITLRAALFSETIVQDQASIGVKPMCKEVASLHRSAFTNTDNEILDYRPDVSERDNNFAQTKEIRLVVLNQNTLGCERIKSLGLVLVPVIGSTTWTREGWWSITLSCRQNQSKVQQRLSESYKDHLKEITLVRQRDKIEASQGYLLAYVVRSCCHFLDHLLTFPQSSS
jgi:hypothetical protein